MHIQLKHILNEMLYELRFNMPRRIGDLEALINAYVNFYTTSITMTPEKFARQKNIMRKYIAEYKNGGPSSYIPNDIISENFMSAAGIWVEIGRRDAIDYDKYIKYIEELFNIENTSESKQDYDLEYSDWSARLKAEVAKNGETVQPRAINDPFL